MKPETFDHAPLVKAWLDEPVWLAESDVGRIAQLVHQTPQRRRWPPTLDRRSFDMMSTATTVIAAGAFVALVGGFVLRGAVGPRPDQPLPPGAELTSPPPGADGLECSVPSDEFASMAPSPVFSSVVMGPPSGASVGGWTEIGRLPATSAAACGFGISDLHALGDRLVALGGLGRDDEGEFQPTVLHSTDGLTWIPASVPGRDARFTDLEPSADGLLMGGSVRGADRREGRLWSSMDGLTWTEVPAPPERAIWQIVSTEAPRAVRLANRLWVTHDGTNWIRGTRLIDDTVQRGPGGFLAILDIGTRALPELRHSDDLTVWTEVAGAPDALEEGDPATSEVVTFPLAEEWVMVASRDVAPDVIWTSPDGLTWSEVPRPVGMSDENVRWIANVGDETQAFAYDRGGGPTGLWTWRLGEEAPDLLPLDPDGHDRMDAPVAFGDGYVATGHDAGEDAAITIWRYESPAAG
jgi:hypothetical protein